MMATVKTAPSSASPAAAPRSQRDRSAKVRRQLNVWLLAGTAVMVAVFAPAAHFWHGSRVARLGEVFLERAAEREEEGAWQEASQNLTRYLQLQPDDASARVRLATVFDRAADSPQQRARSRDLHYHALGVAPPEDQPALRRRLGQLLLSLEQFTAAELEAEALLEQAADDVEGLRIRALALIGQHSSGALASRRTAGESVGEALEKAVARLPADLELASALARVYREEPDLLSPEAAGWSQAQRARRADLVIDAMVDASGGTPDALLTRYRYRVQYGVAGAEEDLEAALAADEDHLEALLLAAASARGQASGERVETQLAEAEALYRRAIAVAEEDERPYAGLGEIYLASARAEEAIAVWEEGLETNESSPRLLALLVEVHLRQNDLEAAERRLMELEQVLARLGPSLPRAARLSFDQSRDLMRARLLVAQGKLMEAIPLLRHVATGQRTVEGEVAETVQAWMLLGGIYASVRQWDQAALSFEQAAALQPQAVRPRLAAAAAWFEAARPDAAVVQYERALALEEAPETHLALARARFANQVRRPVEERDFSALERTLTSLDGPLRDRLQEPWQVDLLRAGLLAARGEGSGDREAVAGRAAAVLRDAEQHYGDRVPFLESLITAYQGLGADTDADRVLAALRERVGQTPEALAAVNLLQARLHAARGQVDEGRALLTEALNSAPASLQPRFRQELARFHVRGGEWEAAQSHLAALHERFPDNVEFVGQLADLALDRGRFEELARWEARLRELEGPQGSLATYYEARRLLASASGTDDPSFARAVELQSRLESHRPAWPQTLVLRGLIFQRQGRAEQALDAYRQAVALGERRFWVQQQIVGLLYGLQRFAEAERYMARMQDRAASSPLLSAMQISMAVEQGELEKALRSAERAVAARPQDPLTHVWLGAMLLASDQPAEAENAFRKGIEVAPDDVRPYEALFQLLARLGRRNEALLCLEEYAAQAMLTSARRSLVFARGYQALGDFEQAENSYREALEAAPEDATVHLRAGAFFLERDAEQAESILRRAVELAPHSGEARRLLAAFLTSRGGEARWQEARNLLEGAEAAGADLTADLRTRARLLVQRGGRDNLAEAQRLLESLVADGQEASVADRLLLARLYELKGEFAAAREQFRALAGQSTPDPTHVALYVGLLIRGNLLDDADGWLRRLESLQPDELRTLRLRADWLAAQGRDAEIEPLVQRAAERLRQGVEEGSRQEAQLALSLGNLLTETNRHGAAEPWYRRVQEIVPDEYRPLVLSLARQGKMEEAVAWCIRPSGGGPDASSPNGRAQQALLLIAVLLTGSPAEEDFAAAEPFLDAVLDEYPDHVELNLQLANLRVLQKRLDEAEAGYRRVLELQPRHLLAMNNLATILAEQPGREGDALAQIDQAIELVGPQPVLLDTKGMVLLEKGRADEAVALLEEAAAIPDADPRFVFHLAVAYHRTGEGDRARDTFARVDRQALERHVLTEKDYQYLGELETVFR